MIGLLWRKRTHPVRGKGRSPPFSFKSQQPSFSPIVRTPGTLMKGGRYVDQSTTGGARTSRPSQSSPSEGPGQGPAQDRRGEIDQRCAVQDCASLWVRELAEAQGSRRIIRGDRTAQAGYRHK